MTMNDQIVFSLYTTTLKVYLSLAQWLQTLLKVKVSRDRPRWPKGFWVD